MKDCENGCSSLTKMAAMPIYGKNFYKSSSPELIICFHMHLYRPYTHLYGKNVENSYFGPPLKTMIQLH